MFIALLLSGVSCTGSGAVSDVSKHVVNTEPCSIVGNVWFDADGDSIRDPNEFGVAGIDVTFYDYGTSPWTEYTDETDFVGTYQIVIPGPRTEDFYGRIQPDEYGQGYDTYAPGPQEIEVPEEEEFVYGPTWRGYDS